MSFELTKNKQIPLNILLKTEPYRHEEGKALGFSVCFLGVYL